MIRFEEARPRSLGDLLEQRAALRRQETMVAGAAVEVAHELRAWRRHELAEEAAGRTVPAELRRLWQDLASRQTELRLDLLQLRHALVVAGRELAAALGRIGPRRAG